jgi:hypothetical protein
MRTPPRRLFDLVRPLLRGVAAAIAAGMFRSKLISPRFASLASLSVMVLAACPYPRLDPIESKSCTTSADCSAPALVCDLDDTGMCVQYTAADDGACAGPTPVCGADLACRACIAHAECGARGCLPDGSCGDDARVAYVDPAGFDNSLCTLAAPCTRVSRALATGRPYVKLVGTIDEQVVVGGGQVVTFVGGPGASLTRASGPGPIVTVQDDGTSLTVYDLSIGDARSGFGLWILEGGSPSVTLVRAKLINNPGGAISAEGSGTLTVTQSLISRNTGGGISVTNGTFAIVGNMFNGNGTDSTLMSAGALRVATMKGGNRLEFNSFYLNEASADPSSNLTGLAARDLDGDMRTSPADIGADEVP